MNYAPPSQAPVCPCNAAGNPGILCPTGHMLECHHPLTCEAAACNHLLRYDEYSGAELDALAAAATARLGAMAEADCTECGGTGLVTRTVETSIPTPDYLREVNPADTISFEAQAVCRCAAANGAG